MLKTLSTVQNQYCLYSLLALILSFPIEVVAADKSEYIGHIHNNTLTNKGLEFYQSFSNMWLLQASSERVNLSILEQMNRGNSSQLKIQYANYDLYFIALNKKSTFDRLSIRTIIQQVSKHLRSIKQNSINSDHTEFQDYDYEYEYEYE